MNESAAKEVTGQALPGLKNSNDSRPSRQRQRERTLSLYFLLENLSVWGILKQCY